ncbi:MAG: DUF222 domain-containing protein [Polyangiaceae bacterium]|nr:DUF222 domain-containing protein [Polyangiaceae bacterium]
MNTEAQLARARIDDLADQIALCAARIDAALHQLLTYIRRFDELKGWAKQGTKSCAHWLSWRIGLGLVAAREKVRVAHALAGLPQTDAALSRGELSYAKVRAITRVATPKNEDLLLHQARGTTGAELERVCAGYRRLAPRQVVATERRTVRRRNLDDGLVQIDLRLLPDEAERVWQAIAEVRRELQAERDDSAESSQHEDEALGPTSSDRPCEDGPSMADAAVAFAERQLANQLTERGTAAADRRTLVVHLSETRLGSTPAPTPAPSAEPTSPWTAELPDGTGLAGATLLRLACDAGLHIAKTDHRGELLDLGRKSRVVSPALARALRLRDRRCRFPGCDHRAFVDAHHIEHWAHGGQTSIDNLVLVCHAHHVALHEGGFSVERGAEGLVFRDPDGVVIVATPRPPAVGPAGGGEVAVDLGATLVRRPFWGIEVDGCVRALVGREGSPERRAPNAHPGSPDDDNTRVVVWP